MYLSLANAQTDALNQVSLTERGLDAGAIPGESVFQMKLQLEVHTCASHNTCAPRARSCHTFGGGIVSDLDALSEALGHLP